MSGDHPARSDLGSPVAQVTHVDTSWTVGLSKPPRSNHASRFTSRLVWCVAATLACAVALVSYRYLVGVGPVPAGIAANRHLSPWLLVHVGGAATALLTGPLQFLPELRTRLPALHRFGGAVYAAGCLAGGGAALVLAQGTAAGPIAGLGFATLGAAWLATTSAGVAAIYRGRVGSHRRWMFRSFSLAFAAVTLRAYLPVAGLLGFGSLSSYEAIAWLCWVPNVILAEWAVRLEPPSRSSASRQAGPNRRTIPTH